MKVSLPLQPAKYRQKRLSCWFQKKFLFYAEYNLRLFFFLLFQRGDCICAIDLDTIIPCWMVSSIKKIKRAYDAHEFFSQLDEVVSRPFIFKTWHGIEKFMVPRFRKGYTVCHSLAEEFHKHYRVDYAVVRNVPLYEETLPTVTQKTLILYQGAVNKGRGLDSLVLAMKTVDSTLVICGSGNYMDELATIIRANELHDKVILKGMLLPGKLKEITAEAYVGVNPFQRKGLNQYLSLSNKFFDYIHAGVPQVTMNYPEYRAINEKFEVAVLIDTPGPNEISTAINRLLVDRELHERLKNNCMLARKEYNWQKEEKLLLDFYYGVLNE